MFNLNPMTSVAQSHKCGYISLHTVPSIPLLEILVHLGTATVDTIGRIMSFPQDGLSKTSCFGHTSSILKPYSSLFILCEIWGFSLFHTFLDFLNPNII
jgi:hypothetical protein